jgi:ATPase family AAA domain-containing protein 2
MPGGKRKFEPFDPNKSDSDDDDYVSGQDRPRKVARKSRTQSKKSSGTKRRKAKYKGSDVSDEDVSDSLLEDSFSEEGEEEVDLDLTTGRRRRTAATKQINYEDPSDSAGLEELEDSLEEKSEEEGKEEEEEKKPPKRSQIIKLKVPTPFAPRTTRAGSAARTRESASSGLPPRRSTRARTEEGEDLIALTNSGRNFEVVRPSRSPEAVTRSRTTRGHKGVKKPASIIKEETEEPSSHEQPAVPEEGETIETDLTQLVEEEQGEQHSASKGNSDDHQNADDRPLAGETDPIDQHRDQAATEVDDADADDDDSPITRAGRTRGSRAAATDISTTDLEKLYDNVETTETSGPSRRLTRKSVARKSNVEQSSDFEPVDESAEEDESVSDDLPKKGKGGSDDNESTPRRGRSSAQEKSKSNRSSRRRVASDDEELDQDELIEEAQELKAGRRANRHRHTRDPDIMYVPGRRERKPVDYTIKPMDQIYAADEDAEDAAPTPSRGPRGRRNGASQPWERSLYTTYGPFGGAGGPPAVIGGPWGTGAIGGVDSDSSDDENIQRPGVGGNVGMTPTSAIPLGMLPGLGQTHATDPIAAIGGTPANLGKIKSQKALADADPLGVDQNVDFSKVGGLAGHIDQLKEMVQMPLLYPELFLKFHVTPPRGVLFHGPPGTGKTLLARALAASVGSGGRKITFYMRKGADALSKWVGEAERQLRLLFEEARKTQPSIIFFDEIDGLAPVRSSKQEQIHASIVSTLLALMDGMDGRGQVIVIGATNRPDNIDPALRRPGRFDREFYFPLPDFEGRRAILDIHTKDWGIDNAFKNSLAHLTKGYGGADLRALCTEAALNAIQRTYPQIYSSNEKLIVNPDKIKITAKDFMLSIKSMIPSSERATSSGAAPLPKVVEPLLREQLTTIEKVIDGLIPIKKKVTALQEAMYEQYDDGDQDFGRETLQQEFEKSRVFRPRLLVHGLPGMGQAYIGAALLNHFEGLHVQNFDLPTIYSDSTRVQRFQLNIRVSC